MNEELAARLDLLLEGQQRLFSEVAALRQAIETSRRREPLPQADTSADLLRAILAAVGDRVFNSANLVELAALPDKAELRAAIVTAVGSTNARRVGKLLHKLEGIGAGGLTVHRVGEDRCGAIWKVAGVRE